MLLRNMIMKKTGKNGSLKNFRTAVESTPDVQTGFKPGLSALGQHSNKIQAKQKSQFNGSLDIDTCTTHLYPNDNRWDYAFSYKSEVYFVEIHSAQTNEVKTVIRKLEWLKNWLRNQAPEIQALTVKKRIPYYWIQSKNFQIPPSTPQHRLAVQHKILPIKILHLD